MTLENVIRKHGKLSPAQEMARKFYAECKQPSAHIDYEHYTASVYVNAFTSQERKIIKKLQKDSRMTVDYNIYPHGDKIEVWFI